MCPLRIHIANPTERDSKNVSLIFFILRKGSSRLDRKYCIQSSITRLWLIIATLYIHKRYESHGEISIYQAWRTIYEKANMLRRKYRESLGQWIWSIRDAPQHKSFWGYVHVIKELSSCCKQSKRKISVATNVGSSKFLDKNGTAIHRSIFYPHHRHFGLALSISCRYLIIRSADPLPKHFSIRSIKAHGSR